MTNESKLRQLQDERSVTLLSLKAAKSDLSRAQRELIKAQNVLDNAYYSQDLAKDVYANTRRHYHSVQRASKQQLSAYSKGGRSHQSGKMVRSARAAHRASKEALQRSRIHIRNAKSSYDAAKLIQEKSWHMYAKHKQLLVYLTGQINDLLAEKAGIPPQYRGGNIIVERDKEGSIHFYFGGAGDPLGPQHGHYVMSSSEKVTYARDPFMPRGPQNFRRKSICQPSVASVQSTKRVGPVSSHTPKENICV